MPSFTETSESEELITRLAPTETNSCSEPPTEEKESCALEECLFDMKMKVLVVPLSLHGSVWNYPTLQLTILKCESVDQNILLMKTLELNCWKYMYNSYTSKKESMPGMCSMTL